MRPHVIAWPIVPRARAGERWRALRDRLKPRLPKDARVFQVLFLGTLLSLGVLARDFTLRPEQMALTFLSALATQAVFMQALGLRHRGILSALVTSFGLSILLRADSLWVHPLAAFLAIAAKFVIRVNDKHLYNPANLGIIVATTLLPGAWISPGQWGNDLAFAALFVALGGTVVAARGASTSRGCSSARGSGWSRCACWCSASRGPCGCTSSAAAGSCCSRSS
jgi:Na+-transporting NADH:ubiquinone oxidoreductase subunit NqrB